MAAIIIPRRHITQPQGRVAVDWANSMALALSAAVDPVTLLERVCGQPCAPTGAALAAEPSGMGRLYNGAFNQVVTPLDQHANRRTYLVRIRRDGAGGGSLGRIFEKRTAAQNTQVEVFYNRGTDPNRSLAYSRIASGNATYEVALAAAEVQSGVLYWVAVTHDSSSISNKPKIYIDGSERATVEPNGAASGSWLTNSAQYVIGNRNNDSARGWDGLIGDFFAWDRVIDADEIAELSRNPWQLFRADPIRIYSFPSGPIIPSLSGLTTSNITSSGARHSLTLTF